MNPRETDIIKAILICLARVAPGSLVEAIIHADARVQLQNKNQNAPSLMEFNRAIVIAEQRGWIKGAEGMVAHRMKWRITDDGILAEPEL